MGSIRFKPRSLVDALDGTDTDGGCSSLKDLIFDPTTPFTMACRPAATQLANSGLGIISVLFPLGTRVYGMAASVTHSGFDEPFCYESASNTFLPVAGISGSNLPATQPSTGAWTPPVMAQAGGRVMVTHPGFPGGAGSYIGWLDISAQTLNETASTQNGSTSLVNVSSVSGVAPGQSVSGAGIAANTSVISVTVGAIAPVTTTGATVSGSASLTNVGTSANAAVGMAITGTGIPVGTTISAITAGAGPFASAAATVSGSPQVTGFAGVANAVAGQAITGTGIPAGTTISAVLSTGGTINFNATTISGSTSLTNVSNSSTIAVGATVTGAGIPAGTTAAAVSAGSGPFTTTVNSVSGSPVLTGVANYANFAVGQAIAGPAIANGSTILSLSPPTTAVVTAGTITTGATAVTNINTAGLANGMPVTGTGIPAGTTVVAFTSTTPGQVIAGITSASGTPTIGVSATGSMAVGETVFFNAPGSGLPAGGATIISISPAARQVTFDQNIPANLQGGVITAGSNIVTLSQAATNSGTTALTFGGPAQVTISSNALSSLSGTGIVYGGGSLTLSQAATVSGTIAALAATSAGTLLLSANATASGSPTLTFGGATFTLSQTATASAAGVSITYGGSTVELSQAMTATAQGITISFSGGSTAAPQWGSGNTSGTPLPSVPQSVAIFNGRAYYACGNTLYFSDSGFPTQITAATQALIVGDNLPIVALAPLPLTTALQGIIQALVAFKQNLIWQITGDISTGNTTTTTSTTSSVTTTTGNLALNTLAIETGTQAPRSIASTAQGIAYMANDGVRVVQPAGTVTAPLKDLRSPFIKAVVPSRVAAAANGSCFRICAQNGAQDGNPTQDFWFDLSKNGWNGPHSFIYDCAGGFKNGFVLCRNDHPGIIYYADYQQQSGSTYTELGANMTFDFQPAPMGDSGDAVRMWSVISTHNVNIPPKPYLFNYSALDEKGNTLASCFLASNSTGALWDASVWDQATWQGASLLLTPRQLPWNDELVFNRLTVDVTGVSGGTVRLGPMEIQVEPLGYPQQ